jgi:hypothetical protein
MAEVLSLVQRDDFTVDIDSISLLAYTNGFEGAYRGWKMQSIPEASGRVIETIKLRAKGTSIDNLAANLQGMADKAWQTERYAPIDRYGVWLRAKLDGETNARQAFVFAMRHEQASSIFDQAMASRFRINEYTLAVERSPYWEGTASTDFASGTTLSALGGTLQYGTISGDAPARMALVQIDHSQATCGTLGVNYNGRWWVGFRSNRYGDPANFRPYWDCALGISPLGGTVLALSDSRGGSVMALGTAVLPINTVPPVSLVRMYMDTQTSNYYDQSGRYLALLRCNPNTAGTFVLQLRYGLNPGRYFANPRVYLVKDADRTSRVVPMGEVDIGGQAPYSVNGTAIMWDKFYMEIYGERKGGTAELYLDTLFLVPLEGFVYFGEPATSNPSPYNQVVYQAMQRANGMIEYAGRSATGGTSMYTVGNAQMIGGIHPGPGVAVVVGEAGALPSVTRTCKLSVRAMPRWKELRGAD